MGSPNISYTVGYKNFNIYAEKPFSSWHKDAGVTICFNSNIIEKVKSKGNARRSTQMGYGVQTSQGNIQQIHFSLHASSQE